MNDRENYNRILERYFGAGASSFDVMSTTTNEVIQALNRTDFKRFKAAFFQRLKRLATVYPNQDGNRKHLLDTVNLLSTEKNWQGVYAELVAFDFLNSDQNWLLSPINLSKTVPALETLADGLGNINVNLDGFYDDFDVCFDVKVLSDKSRAILDGLIKEVKQSLGISALISPEYPLDTDYEVFQYNRNDLVAELKVGIDAAKNSSVKSKIVPELSFKIIWDAGVLTTISTYDPYIHAEEHHKLLFAHIKKFSRIRPGLIVFVVFPWFSEKVTTQPDTARIFYRAFCRRFFCQYAEDTEPAKSILKTFRGDETVGQITEKLSGILFLEDTSMTPVFCETESVKAFAYLNPNALHKVGGHFRDYLASLNCFVDDYSHDNY